MNRVYRHQPLAPDEYLGWVDLQGQVFEARFGPDRKIGRVDPASGRIYEARLGPDQLIGRVDLETGRVYLARIGPDQHIGQVHADGKIYLHRRLARDEYIGRVREMSSLAHGGAALLLLVQPAYDEARQRAEENAEDTGDLEAGQATNPA
ncbi:MAG: hypothetical protein GX495_13975 [Chloroflexi bacterium]|jgi:hypothetical protein|nr:hypothetical protein [Chloroflexota bacterium]